MKRGKTVVTGPAAPAAPDINLRSAWFEPTVHSAYFQIFSNLVADRGQGRSRTFVGQPRLLPVLDFLPLLDAVDAVGSPGQGVDVGRAMLAPAHGPMGLAAMASGSIREAMETIARYAPIRNRMFRYRCYRSDGDVVLAMPARLSFGDYGPFLQNATLHAIFNIFRAVLDDGTLGHALVTLPWASPHAQPAPAPTGPWREHYGVKELAIRFPVPVAERALASADPNVYQRVCQAGEEELTKIDGSVGSRMRHIMHREQPHWPSLTEAAAALGLSRRTLVRRLEDEGLSYQYLLDEARNELACWYLRHTELALKDISEKVGFSEQANFSRGFQRWQGLSPREYRRVFRPETPPAD